jgi:predicted RNA binding protein YcfA (HicA-like mRNA interferase family)
MKLPRNVEGDELARLLSRYGYHIDHQTGSHQRLSANISGKIHYFAHSLSRSVEIL